MSRSLDVSIKWENLEDGRPEECATFSALSISLHDQILTELKDGLVGAVTDAPYLSAYHLAEWLAWNWWRLRWEPFKARDPEWLLAHDMSTIGAGYVWPNIRIWSDGQRVALSASPTRARKGETFRYISDFSGFLPASDFESGVDTLVELVRERLHSRGLTETDLEKTWACLADERSDPEMSRFRILEAMAGHDPDEGDPDVIKRLISMQDICGEDAVSEIAAAHPTGKEPLSWDEIRVGLEQSAYEMDVSSQVGLTCDLEVQPSATVPPWQVGVAAARALRKQEGLGEAPLSNRRLGDLFGVSEASLEDNKVFPALSFAFQEGTTDTSSGNGNLVFRSKWPTSRRFDLCRMIGDRIMCPGREALLPVAQTHTARQKMQKAFAGEFLSPFQAVEDMLEGDLSEEKQKEVAAHFNVSEYTVQTLLMNHGRLERRDLTGDFEQMVA